MTPEHLRITFRYRRGQPCQWAGDPGCTHVVLQRRWTQRDVLAPLVEYLVMRVGDPPWRAYWAAEADLAPVEVADGTP